jgi:ankyrin repeat protein
MNPTTRIFFIQKIIGYAMPKKIEEIPKQLETCFEVNDNWNETVIYYLDHIWTSKGNYDKNTVWHWAVMHIKSEKFWEVIAQKDDSFFEKYWNISNRYGDTVLHYAVKGIKSENFWEIIAQKNDL